VKKHILILAVTLLIFVIACQEPTEGCFTYSPSYIDTTTVVTFNASCSQNASYFNWSFGDNTKDTMVTSITFTHNFSASGTYTVTLNAARKDGMTLGKSHPKMSQVIEVH